LDLSKETLFYILSKLVFVYVTNCHSATVIVVIFCTHTPCDVFVSY